MSFRIAGTGSCLPEQVVENEAFCGFVDTSDEWIVSRTGMRRRHFVKEETMRDLVYTAASRALEDAGCKASELDYILCSTIQGDYITPSLACLLQADLGANCPAMDINAACSGFLYALDAAAAQFAAKKAKTILVVGAEQLSKFLDWSDRNTCVLFGDGAGAVVLTEGEGLLSIRLGSYGQMESLNIPGSSSPGPFSDFKRPASYIHMNGQEIFKFAVSAIQREIRTVTAETGITPEEVDYFLLHQANGRIIESARNRMKQPKEKFPTNYEECGNTSSASIPLLLDSLNTANRLKNGDILLMSAFGGGLTTGTCLLKWNK
ncbi:beta-ketoacyl-ACP synthase III [Papillibacter cinnamivorans]|uniref:Beta-ketoacyl-[acyl-carrier-protein] synthase III n=1 Tax=Papillibacter cinnamivorans DSM 12816 TaxID=1122930 RepID=A0A1W2AH65_9FIRM|nr:beta-ketoacyl-ACP synthase III [Papillibacter cinnamivorans]SMC60036.1 3-oxoacyl-[acyl-carrier-protein] synthase-3 [Papillibacter cinnamivorans DSM 12816]